MKHSIALFATIFASPFVWGQSLCFDPANDSRYETDGMCTDLVTMDLDQDGQLDVITNAGDQTLLFKGNGDGTFQPYEVLSATGGTQMESVDIDLDGDMDVVRYSSGVVNIGLNNGLGNLLEGATFVFTLQTSNFSQLALADLNGDDAKDLIVNDLGSNEVQIAINEGDGTFITSFALATVEEPGNVHAQDLNDDGLAEIVVSSAVSELLYIHINTGNNNFTALPIDINSTVPNGLAPISSGDFDDDNDLDLMVAGSAQAIVVHNMGNDTFSSSTPAFNGVYAYGQITGDWNNDGWLDAAWANFNNGGITALVNDGDNTWSSPYSNNFYTSWGNSEDLESGDFDGDQILDIVVANGGAQHFAFLKGNGDGSFGLLALRSGYNSAGLTINDFDEDGDLDVIATNNNSLANSVMALSRNNGDGSFSATEYLPSVAGAGEAASADFNTDNIADVILHSNQGYALFIGTGDGTFDEPLIIPTSNLGAGGDRTIALGDYNGDGILDIAGSRVAANNIGFLYGQGNLNFTAPVVYTDNLNYARCIITAQLNDDNYDDLVVCSNSSDEVFIYFGTANNAMEAPVVIATPGAPEGLVSFDADEDGDNDLFVASPNANRIYFIESNNDQTFAAPVFFDTPNGANANRMSAADINNDGHLDIACAFYQQDAAGVFFGNGDGTFQPAFSYFMDQGPNQIFCADFNDDGAIDFATLNSAIFNVSVMLNNSAYINYSGDLAFCQGGSVTLTASEGYSYLWSNGETTQAINATASSTYSCAITNQSGTCTLLTPEVIVEVYQGQQVTLNLDSTQVCLQTSPFFLSGGFPFGGLYTGDGVTAGNFNPASVGPGIYQITYAYEDPGSCTNGNAVASIEVVDCNTIEESLASQTLIYPNPARDYLMIRSNHNLNFRIVNMQGQVVKTGAIRSGQSIDLNMLATGMYTIHLNDDNIAQSQVFVITE
jgi:hypothetical protein